MLLREKPRNTIAKTVCFFVVPAKFCPAMEIMVESATISIRDQS